MLLIIGQMAAMAAEWMSERQSPQSVHVNKNYVCPHQKNAKNICRIKNVFYLPEFDSLCSQKEVKNEATDR